MASERQVVSFEQLLSEPVRNGIYKPKGFHGRGTKIVNMGELFAHSRLRAVPMKRVELSESESERFILSEGDLLFARRSLVAEGAGKCSIVMDIDEPTTFESSIIRARPDRAKADPLYLYYFFNSRIGLHCLDAIRRQVAVAGVTGSDLSRLEIPIPPLSEQRAISHILGTLDDKIELNRRMNETLEAMARAIFKSWFVDFDPVRAKAEGRDHGLPKHIEDFFPDRFDDSELGEIPVGWKVVSFLDVADLLSGGTPSTTIAEYWNGDIPWVSAKDVSGASGKFLLETEKTISQLGVDNSSTKILPAFTTIITARGTVGSYCLLGKEMAMNQTNYGLRARNGIGSYFVFFSTVEMIDRLRQHAYGTIFDTITTKTFHDTMIIKPPKPVLEKFEIFVKHIMAKVLSNEHESRTLSTLRDTLLPKLISGELRVKYADKFLEATL